jgi:phage terminase small subunit
MPVGFLLAGGGLEIKNGRKVMVVAKLTAKQQRFCDEYLIDLNATKAAIRAGYSEKRASEQAYQLLHKTTVKKFIEERMNEKEKTLIADQDEVLRYLTSVLRGESQSVEIVVEGTGMGCSKAKTMLKEPSEKDKLKAAELLGKRYGIYTDNVDVNGVVPVVIAGDDELAD